MCGIQVNYSEVKNDFCEIALACKTGLICKIIEPSGFKNKILSTHKAPSHIMTKFLLDQTVLGGFKHANMRNCQVS